MERTLTRPGARRLPAAVALSALLVVVTGCSGGDDEGAPTGPVTPTSRVLQGAAPGEENTLITEIPEVPDFVKEEDLQFVRNMLLHHAQALEMTTLVPEQGERDDVALFAERIHLSQEDEIALMQNWLKERGEPVFDLSDPGGHAHDEQMSGMLTPEQMQELRAASGEEFDTLFLQFMYVHHDGAVKMVEDLLAADAAQDTFIFQLAKEIDGDQRIEMDRIIGMLADVGEQPLPATD